MIEKFRNTIRKPYCLIFVLIFFLLLTVAMPSLARYKNRNTILDVTSWDGTIASSYRKGTGILSDPYIISNGNELAYFSKQLENNNYDNTYFRINNDIVLNSGVFSYDATDGIKYTLEDKTYYVEEYTNAYYKSKDHTGEPVGYINTLNSLNNFKGILDAQNYVVYGLYISDSEKDQLGLFTNLQGSVSNLYVENSIIDGGVVTGGFASNTKDAQLNNILFDGSVIGRTSNIKNTVAIEKDTQAITVTNDLTPTNITFDIPKLEGIVKSIKLMGNYAVKGSQISELTLSINDTEVSGGNFEIDLGTTLINSITLTASTTSLNQTSLEITDLKYIIEYEGGVASGISAKTENTTITNSINKADIYSNYISAGIVGDSISALNITNSYNTGNTKSNSIASGIIGTIESNASNNTITNSYNSGNQDALNTSGIVTMIKNNPGIVNITNTFDISMSPFINTIENNAVILTNDYYINQKIVAGTYSGSLEGTTLTNLIDKTFMINTLGYLEYNTQDNTELDAWVYEEGQLPILSTDDIKNPVGQINLSKYSWNNLSPEPNNTYLKDNTSFTISDVDIIYPLTEKYYFISSTVIPDNQLAIQEWKEYSNVVELDKEGTFVIYAKLVDYNGKTSYINSDKIIIDKTAPTASATLDTENFITLNSNPGYTYINTNKNVTITALDNLSGISHIDYYIADKVLTNSELTSLTEDKWIEYKEPIPITNVGTSIVYIKTTDNSKNVSYINTNTIVYGGYNESSIELGKNSSTYNNINNNITSKSSVTLNIQDNIESSYISGDKHQIKSNILLPLNTELTLIDNIDNRVYSFMIDSEEDIYGYNDSCLNKENCEAYATYSLESFKEIGTLNEESFSEEEYYNGYKKEENLKLIIDFAKTNLTSDYENVKISLEKKNSSNIIIRPTINESVKTFSVYSTVESQSSSANLQASTTLLEPLTLYNAESTNNIDISSALNNKLINTQPIYDTQYEGMHYGIKVRITDSNNTSVTKQGLKNFGFVVDGTTYYPDSDGVILIDFNNLSSFTKTLQLITYQNNNSNLSGTYSLIVNSYISQDGTTEIKLLSNDVIIPLTIINEYTSIPYTFSVTSTSPYKIINKANGNVSLTFNALQTGISSNANIKLSLYKKHELTPFDQTYDMVDISPYITNELTMYETNKYNILSTIPENTSTPINITINASSINKGAYNYVFELYDGNTRIGFVEKKFVVK